MDGLTERQSDVLRVMIDHVVEHHTHAPVRHIGAALGLRSTNCVLGHVRALERRGFVEQVDVGGYVTRRVLRWPDGAPFTLRPVRTPTPPCCESCGDQDGGCDDCNGAA